MATAQSELHAECIAFLESADARSAFEYLMAPENSPSAYERFLRRQGYLHTCRYTQGKSWPFGFIINRRSLLFYFRKAGLTSSAAMPESLVKEFSEVKRNARGEIKVRLQTERDAQRVSQLVFGDA